MLRRAASKLPAAHKIVVDPDAYRGDMVDALFKTVKQHMKSINTITHNMAVARMHEQATPETAGAALFLRQSPQPEPLAQPQPRYGIVCDDPMAYYTELGIDMHGGGPPDSPEARDSLADDGDDTVCYLQNMAHQPAPGVEPLVSRRMLDLSVFRT